MDKIKLFDGTTLNIEDYASISHIVHKAGSTAKAQAAAEKFTDENLRHVEFLHGSETAGIYDDLGLTQAEEGGSNPTIDGATVTISLYQK